jgi:hypothetical protein
MRKECPAFFAAVQSSAAASSAERHIAGSRIWLPAWNEIPAMSSPSRRPRSISLSASRGEQPNLRESGQSASEASISMRTITRAPGACSASLTISSSASAANCSTPTARACAISAARLIVLPKAMWHAGTPSPRQRSISPREAASNRPPKAAIADTTSGAGFALTA